MPVAGQSTCSKSFSPRTSKRRKKLPSRKFFFFLLNTISDHTIQSIRMKLSSVSFSHLILFLCHKNAVFFVQFKEIWQISQLLESSGHKKPETERERNKYIPFYIQTEAEAKDCFALQRAPGSDLLVEENCRA